MASVISIIIATRNRADHLRRTLESLAHVRVPATAEAELTLVDNGSTDETRQVAQAFDAPRLPLHYVLEPRPGKARALNTALRHARGHVLLCTDDDVRVPPGWIEGMSAPILGGEADAVAGGVELAPHLRRPWMNTRNTGILATTDVLAAEYPQRMVGANMAFSKAVLEKVPGFDPELGPGALGLGEETLFSRQLLAAGFRIVAAFDVVVEHHFNPSRLSRASHLAAVERLGRSEGYISYHWKHSDKSRLGGRMRSYARLAKLYARLICKRMVERGAYRAPEGMLMGERHVLHRLYRTRQSLKEHGRPRNYERFGLVRRRRPPVDE